MNDRVQLLLDANDIVNGDRNREYGDPYESFSKIRDLWNSLGYTHKGKSLTVLDVGIMMIALKLARASHKGDVYDSLLDICGYATLSNYTHLKEMEDETRAYDYRGLIQSQEDSSGND